MKPINDTPVQLRDTVISVIALVITAAGMFSSDIGWMLATTV
ncbi:hypothetical protein [Motiliproteus sediminis]|nr:hypothetical protein [Motiliproteus sediminis]